MARRFGGLNQISVSVILSLIFDKMVHSCCAYGCTNRMEKQKKLGFFRFPSKGKEKDRRERWIRALKRKDWNPTANSRICGDHFVNGMLQILFFRAKNFPSEQNVVSV